MKVKMTWLSSPSQIGGRRVHKGDTFMVSRVEGKVLAAIGKAEFSPDPVQAEVFEPQAAAAIEPEGERRAENPTGAQTASVADPGAEPSTEDDGEGDEAMPGESIEELRAKYERSTGRTAGARWGIPRLKRELAAGYGRRDMRADGEPAPEGQYRRSDLKAGE